MGQHLFSFISNAHQAQRGHALLDLGLGVMLLGIWLCYAMPMTSNWTGRWQMQMARGLFEDEWRSARWRAQMGAQVLRIRALPDCPSAQAAGSWSCGWQLVSDNGVLLLHETRLPLGLQITVKPDQDWRIDAWGEPLSGGASILFASVSNANLVPELLCMNVLGRLRRLRAETCSD